MQNAKNHFLLLNKLKNTESAQLCNYLNKSSIRDLFFFSFFLVLICHLDTDLFLWAADFASSKMSSMFSTEPIIWVAMNLPHILKLNDIDSTIYINI